MKWIDTIGGLYSLDRITFLNFRHLKDCDYSGIELEAEDKYGKPCTLVSFGIDEIKDYAEISDITLDFSDKDTERKFLTNIINSMQDRLIDFLEDESKVFNITGDLIESIEEEAKCMIS